MHLPNWEKSNKRVHAMERCREDFQKIDVFEIDRLKDVLKSLVSNIKIFLVTMIYSSMNGFKSITRNSSVRWIFAALGSYNIGR